MAQYRLMVTLKSDTTFGRGDGVPGLIDREAEHDRYGMPFLRGRTLKGLLNEEADNVIDALEQCGRDIGSWEDAKMSLFGKPGSLEEQGTLHFGRCQLPTAIRQTVIASIDGSIGRLSPADTLNSLTAIRRQTAIDASGVPVTGSLRSMRVIIRESPFSALLESQRGLTQYEKGLFAASVKALRRAGTGRNRGRGRLYKPDLREDGVPVLMDWFAQFKQLGGWTDEAN